MLNISEGEAGSCYTYLSRGCKLCQEGAKMVLFITGICGKNCFYCPISDERKKDITFANERPVNSDMDIIEEAKQMGALGTGITGGEPLLEPEKVFRYIKVLRSEFGKEHHIHLYTALPLDDNILEQLAAAGLDEIRFHPPADIWNINMENYASSIKKAMNTGMEAGLEIPAIEGAQEVARMANEVGCFLNMNELEFSDTNSQGMKLRGYRLRDEISNAADGSYNIGVEILKTTEKGHLCTSRYKDAVQLRRRLLRIAERTAREFDELTEDGTIIYGIITCSSEEKSAQHVAELLLSSGVPEELFQVSKEEIHIAAWILEEIKMDISADVKEMCIIERYPFPGGMIVEKIPL
ncbi:MAG: Radical SAM superfamily protein [Methanomethylovorans sp. PtaU1.Bin093]|uniref:radical SAM protein n=1 Tax=Methanomethylovorans sp. PtaU1.Bin093 TaxID=1811679 RepID=UPI0009C6762A|nr:radical SAM protein [Methanomethylovorans sp. PtaU1.Bin093]OPY21747.1 MAG: Radical SAM superfamily protein [Methanomethylovorans sp. PtaU1.Bin093]